MVDWVGTNVLERRRRNRQNSDRTLRDRSSFNRVSGKKLRGYYHVVPSGQNLLKRLVRKIGSTSLRWFEDEDDDEDDYEKKKNPRFLSEPGVHNSGNVLLSHNL